MKTLAKLNYVYDNVKEPKRIFIAMGTALFPWFIFDTIGMLTDNIVFDFLGMAWIICLIAIRMWWRHGNLKKYLGELPESGNGTSC